MGSSLEGRKLALFNLLLHGYIHLVLRLVLIGKLLLLLLKILAPLMLSCALVYAMPIAVNLIYVSLQHVVIV